MRTKTLLSLVILFHAFVFSQEDAQELGNLPDAVSETSGLLFHNGMLITHNDSGNMPQLFEIDTVSLEITRTITISNVENVDWEDLAQDADYIYIGDFGNNVGTRTDLAVYRIRKEDYDGSDAVQAERLDFSYEDQTDFTDSGNSDWDAEAFFVLNNDLIILTKQWKSNGTVVYSIPKTPGTHVAQRIEEFNSNGLLTGATYNPLSEVLFIIGYSSTLGSFTIRADKPTNAAIFGATPERISFGGGLAQIEGITYVDRNTYLVSSEFFTNASPAITLQSKLFSFKTTDMTEEEEPEVPEEPEPEEEVVIEEPEPAPATFDRTSTITANFLPDSSQFLSTPWQSQLNELAAYLKQNTDQSVTISGFAAQAVSPTDETELSNDRAMALADALTTQGVNVSQITVVAKAYEDPIGNNTTADGLAQNRRAVITVNN